MYLSKNIRIIAHFTLLLVLLIGDYVSSTDNIRTRSTPSLWYHHGKTHKINKKYDNNMNNIISYNSENHKKQLVSSFKPGSVSRASSSKDQIMLATDQSDFVYHSVVPPPDHIIQSYQNEHVAKKDDETKYDDRISSSGDLNNSSMPLTKTKKDSLQNDINYKSRPLNISTSTTKTVTVIISKISEDTSNTTAVVKPSNKFVNISQHEKVYDSHNSLDFMPQVSEKIKEKHNETNNSFHSNETYDLPIPSPLQGRIDDFVEQHRSPLIAQVIDPLFVDSKYSSEGFYQQTDEAKYHHMISRPKRRRNRLIRNRIKGMGIFPENKRVHSKNTPFLQLPLPPKIFPWQRVSQRPRPGSRYLKGIKEWTN